MKLVDSPKKEKPVDALTEERQQKFLLLCPRYPLDFHCIRTADNDRNLSCECMGLKWSDIDEKNCTIRIERNIVSTPECGVNRQLAKNSDQHPHPHYPHHAKHIVLAQAATKGDTIPAS